MKRKFVFLSFIFYAAGNAVFAQPEHRESDLLLRRADQYRIQKDFENAFQLYNQVLLLDSKNVHALNGRGVMFQQRGDYFKALADFQLAYSINPHVAETKHNLEVVNNRIKSQAGMPDSFDNYKDTARVLGTQEYTLLGKSGMPVQPTPVQPAPMQTVPMQTAPMQPTPMQAIVPNAAPIPVPAFGGNPHSTPSYVGNYAPAAPGGVKSLYERNTNEETAKGSLYDRSIANSPGSPYFQDDSPPSANQQNNGQTRYGYTSGYPTSAQQQGTAYSQSAYPLLPYSAYSQALSGTAPSAGRIPQPAIPVQPSLQSAANAAAQSGGLKSLRLEGTAETNGYYERAVLAYTDVISRNPNFAVAYNNRGVAYARLGEWQRAFEDFNAALRVNPYYFDAQANRAGLKSSVAASGTR